jgi:hypothetical protein
MAFSCALAAPAEICLKIAFSLSPSVVIEFARVAAPHLALTSSCDLRFAAALTSGVRCARYRGVRQAFFVTGTAGIIGTKGRR